MKILHLLSSNRFSGAENVACAIMQMTRDKVESVYCSPEGPIRKAVEEKGLSFVPLSSMSALPRILREEKPDLVHAHDVRASIAVSLFCRKIPFVSHIHSNSHGASRFSLKSFLYMLSAMRARHILWVSKSTLDGYYFHRLLQRKSSVLYNVIDIHAVRQKMLTDTKSYPYDIVYVGRLTYQKNPQRLINVLSRVVSGKPDIKIAIVGEGDLLEETKALCREKNLTDRIDFLGFMENPLKVIHDAKAMLMTSRFEGTPMCALEALALGTPIVSTPTDGLCELIENGKNGYLSEKDEALARHLLSLMDSPEKQRAFSAEAEHRSVIYNDLRAYREKLTEIYFG
jgi:glycosyltransferase involved in cell wall biosynthesis